MAVDAYVDGKCGLLARGFEEYARTVRDTFTLVSRLRKVVRRCCDRRSAPSNSGFIIECLRKPLMCSNGPRPGVELH